MVETRITPGPASNTLKQLTKAFTNKIGKVGWFKSDRYPREDVNEAIYNEHKGKYKHPKSSKPGELVAAVAYKQEYGDPTNPIGPIPPRPFLRPTILGKKNQWSEKLQGLIRSAFQGKFSPFKILPIISDIAAANSKKTITEIYSPPLSKYTIKKRQLRLNSKVRSLKPTAGLTKPLVETGIMLNTLFSEVVNDTRK